MFVLFIDVLVAYSTRISFESQHGQRDNERYSLIKVFSLFFVKWSRDRVSVNSYIPHLFLFVLFKSLQPPTCTRWSIVFTRYSELLFFCMERRATLQAFSFIAKLRMNFVFNRALRTLVLDRVARPADVNDM